MDNKTTSEEFPVGYPFLEWFQHVADKASRTADDFAKSSGKALPASVEGLGNVLSLLYRAACCTWGCRGGDHQIEWLTGRVVNTAASGHRLLRAGFYDESLMLTRSIGEIANLLWLFKLEPEALAAWQGANRRERLRSFGPASVRKRLESQGGLVPIDQERYQRLCEIGTHPTPGFRPGHYSGMGRPVLGVLLQPAGVYVSVTELCYSTARSAVSASKLLGLADVQKNELRREAVGLIRSLGATAVLNYEELIRTARRGRDS